MALTRPTYDVDNVQQLADLVQGQATLLKQTLDKTGSDTKVFLSDTHIPEVEALDAQNVKLTGDQTVAGVKTFSSSPIVPAPTADMQPSTKKYVDDKDTAQTNALSAHKNSADHDGRYYTADEINSLDAQNVKLTWSQSIGGIKTFTSSPVVPTPTTDMQAATKKYVDDNSPVLQGSIHDQFLGNDAGDIKQRFSAHLAETVTMVEAYRQAGDLDYQTIQRAINACPAGSRLLFSKGKSYSLTSPITLKSGIIYDFNNCSITTNTQIVDTKWITGTSISNFQLLNLTATEQNTALDNGANNLFYLVSCSDFAIEHCDIGYYNEANIRAIDCLNFKIINNKLHHSRYRGCVIGGISSGKISLNECYNNGFHGIFLADGVVECDLNYCHDNSQYGIFIYSTVAAKASNNITVKSNKCVNNLLGQIFADYNCSNVRISKNICSGSLSKPSISINASTQTVQGDNFEIVGNVCATDIVCYAMDNSKVSLNSCSQIALYNCKGAEIALNNIDSLDATDIVGIYVAAYSSSPSENIVIKQNKIINSKRVGISTVGVVGQLIIENNSIDSIITDAGYGDGIRVDTSADELLNKVCNNVITNTALFGVKLVTNKVLCQANKYTGAGVSYGGAGVAVSQIVGENYVVLGTVTPTTGTWKKGDRFINSNPTVGQPKAWVCTVGGTPGTWVSEGNL